MSGDQGKGQTKKKPEKEEMGDGGMELFYIFIV